MDRSSNTQIYTTGPTFIKQKSTSFLFIQKQHTCKWSKKRDYTIVTRRAMKTYGLIFYTFLFDNFCSNNLWKYTRWSVYFSIRSSKETENQSDTNLCDKQFFLPSYVSTACLLEKSCILFFRQVDSDNFLRQFL